MTPAGTRLGRRRRVGLTGRVGRRWGRVGGEGLPSDGKSRRRRVAFRREE